PCFFHFTAPLGGLNGKKDHRASWTFVPGAKCSVVLPRQTPHHLRCWFRAASCSSGHPGRCSTTVLTIEVPYRSVIHVICSGSATTIDGPSLLTLRALTFVIMPSPPYLVSSSHTTTSRRPTASSSPRSLHSRPSRRSSMTCLDSSSPSSR